eukprot:4634513-Pleurochrysis_carterae.AAC.2
MTMKVNVKCSSNGATLSIELEGSSVTVLQLKELIAAQADVPPAQQVRTSNFETTFAARGAQADLFGEGAQGCRDGRIISDSRGPYNPHGMHRTGGGRGMSILSLFLTDAPAHLRLLSSDMHSTSVLLSRNLRLQDKARQLYTNALISPFLRPTSSVAAADAQVRGAQPQRQAPASAPVPAPAPTPSPPPTTTPPP